MRTVSGYALLRREQRLVDLGAILQIRQIEPLGPAVACHDARRPLTDIDALDVRPGSGELAEESLAYLDAVAIDAQRPPARSERGQTAMEEAESEHHGREQHRRPGQMMVCVPMLRGLDGEDTGHEDVDPVDAVRVLGLRAVPGAVGMAERREVLRQRAEEQYADRNLGHRQSQREAPFVLHDSVEAHEEKRKGRERMLELLGELPPFTAPRTQGNHHRIRHGSHEGESTPRTAVIRRSTFRT